ncbi:hypothetical protein [Nostoc sp. UHCC 0251]|uniref:hypothetical protein n=1 Tax=Nostoc sp. UHCC 0251 TaxID=3110240 RepID=UPI002B1FC202|nr:hypothetical protein [Nostoc sp. UHCC 0251]MEA5625322.1 hypothetical protein [Nostoc sp. UHCC 0251]
MVNLIELLHNSQRANQIALDSQGRSPYGTLGVVVKNEDPDKKRRVKVALASSPQLESDWLRRLSTTPFVDEPLPLIGQTVLVLWADGLETNGYYLSVGNLTNPPRDKDDIVKDYSSEIPGNKSVLVNGNDDLTVKGEVSVTSEKSVTTKADLDCKVEVKRNFIAQALQAITLSAAQYILLSAGNWFFKLYSNGTSEMGGSVLTVDCAGLGISFVNVGTMSINSKSVAVVGAIDSDGEPLVTRGW